MGNRVITILRNCFAEIVKIHKLKLVIISFVYIIVGSLVFYNTGLQHYKFLDSTTISLGEKMLSSMLLNLSLFNIVFISVVSAFLGSGEYLWGTLEICISKYNIKSFLIIKLLSILIYSFLITSFVLILTIIMNYINKLPTNIQFNLICSQYFTIIFVTYFWGIISFSISFITKTPLTGLAIGIILPIFEPFLYKYVDIRFILPVFSQKGVLINIFNNLNINNNDFIIVSIFNHLNPIQSLLIVFVYLIGTIFILFKKASNLEI
ncbi:MAG: hypothetical protein ACOWWH_00565 [Eubacteriaceae bacterium]